MTLQLRHNARRHRRGQALVEMALVLPLFLFFTLAVVDMGRVFASYIALTDGVRQAALYASEGPINNTHWCADPDDADEDTVPCPPGADLGGGNYNPDPENIADQLGTTGLDPLEIVMEDPTCTPPSPPSPPSLCDDPSAVQDTVTIRARYDVELLIPGLRDLMGGPVTLTAATTASVLP